jgi:hypothetical protein
MAQMVLEDKFPKYAQLHVKYMLNSMQSCHEKNKTLFEEILSLIVFAIRQFRAKTPQASRTFRWATC